MKKEATRAKERMRRSKLTRPDAGPLAVRAHHLLCAVCARGGCPKPPPGRQIINRLLKTIWQYPYAELKIAADADVVRGHYSAAWGKGEANTSRRLPANFRERSADYDGRRKDLEVLRRLGIPPNSVLPAYWAYRLLFLRAPSLEGICRTSSPPSEAWPECPWARKGYYEKIAGEAPAGLAEQTRLGEKLDGKGIWAMLRPRTRQDMKHDKQISARSIATEAKRLFIRPNHLLCILCTAQKEDPLIHDNLVELRKRMEADPDIPVTLVEGCCMVCDPCNVYHPAEHLCYAAHIKNPLRDLMVLERLGLPPGATLPARELYQLIYDRIGSLREICGWADETNTAPFWGRCGNYQSDALKRAREKRLIAGTSG